jgi:hypothetical protein
MMKMMKLNQLIVLLPLAMFSIGLTTGCGGTKENKVIEAAPTTAEEEATYEQESYGTPLNDESQN